MPELPEVETTRRGIEPHLLGRRIVRVVVREPRLRWPIPAELPERLAGARVEAVTRRAKYLLLATQRGTAILHLGMSGSLRIRTADEPPGRHDHVDLVLEDGRCLRLTDPRRFGALLWCEGDVQAHPLLRDLGPEPLGPDFDAAYLFARSRGRRGPVKPFLMDSHVVVGVGNIYANEALFRAGIRPQKAAGSIGRDRYARLAEAVHSVLTDAIAAGGTTLRDFVASDGRPGYFAQSLAVYGRAEEACPACGRPIRTDRLGQRSTFWCPRCQR
jgi:formamidopyrimidine-DNA glycosylase